MSPAAVAECEEVLGKAISLGTGMWPVPSIEPALVTRLVIAPLVIADADAHVRCTEICACGLYTYMDECASAVRLQLCMCSCLEDDIIHHG